MVLAAIYFLPKYLRIGLTTIPEYLGIRFDKQTRIIASLLFLFSYAVAILPVVLLFGASGLEEQDNRKKPDGMGHRRVADADQSFYRTLDWPEWRCLQSHDRGHGLGNDRCTCDGAGGDIFPSEVYRRSHLNHAMK